MPVGEVSVRLNLNKDGYSAGMTAARQQAQALGRAVQEAGHTTVSQMQAASASIRLLEGGMTGNIRAAERFISTIPGVGQALQAAFPVVGALAFAGVIARIGEEAYKAVHELGQIRNVAGESFAKLSEGAQKSADGLRVTNDKLEQQIAALEHKPINNLALALDEARLRADDLASSLNNDYQQFKKIIEETQKGALSTLFNKGVDAGLGNDMNNQLANIRTLAREQRDALKAGNQDAADDLGRKLRTAQDAALAYADNQTRIRNGIANQGTVREAPYARVYGDQGQNFDAISAFKDLVSGQVDTADQQSRNTADQARAKALENAKAMTEAQKQAQELIVQGWHKAFDENKADNDMTLAQEAEFWNQRVMESRKGSLSYADALDETNKLIAQMRGENMRGGKAFDATSAQSYLPGSMDLSRGDAGAEKQQGRDASSYLNTLNQSIALHRQNADAIHEASVQMALMTGQMSRLDAAQAMAAIHLEQYKDAISAIDTALANAQNLPDGFDKQGTIQGLRNQRSQASASYQIQSAQDQQGISSQQVGPAAQQALSTMVQNWGNMTASIIAVVTKAMDGFNTDITDAILGRGKKGDFGKTFSDLGQGLVKTGLQKGESMLMGALGLGKPDGSKANPYYTIAAAGSGAAASGIDLSSPARTAQVGLQDLVPGTSFIRPFIDMLPHFAGGGDATAGYPAMVGERGPEMFVPYTSGRIVPNHKLAGGGDTYHQYNVDARGATDPMAVEAAVRRALPGAVAASVQAVHAHAKRSPRGR